MINQDESQQLVAGSSRLIPKNLTHTAMFTARPASSPTAIFIARPASSPQRPKKPYNPNAVCDFCHMKDHLRIDCLKLLNCDFCHKTGHLKLNCYKLNGYPPHYKGKREVVVAGNSMYDAGSVHRQDSMTMTPYQQCPPLSPYYIPPPQPPGG
ncbi:hypothetical protein H5410_012833 [Solanum commersonii]|uniref:Uncharacterized protein n=1 Tax=Solanum commersonii TaxID=4109 RepID=A0A9J6ATY8_SOLCO|nr:hypothetical protein H5410_012833 [Solanum commersonii]